MTPLDRALDVTAPASPEKGADSQRPAAPPPMPGRVIPVALLGEPPVVLTDPPAILGGASHTW